jgi:hypothetical protein
MTNGDFVNECRLVTMLVENGDQASSGNVDDRRGDGVSWYEMVSNHANENGDSDLTNDRNMAIRRVTIGEWAYGQKG